jgi:hypothetical protein
MLDATHASRLQLTLELAAYHNTRAAEGTAIKSSLTQQLRELIAYTTQLCGSTVPGTGSGIRGFARKRTSPRSSAT